MFHMYMQQSYRNYHDIPIDIASDEKSIESPFQEGRLMRTGMTSQYSLVI